MYKKFKVRAVYIPTNRKRTETLIAKDEEELIERLKNSDFKEPFDIEEIFNESTDRQLEYAKDLGIKVPKDASLEDVSALISRNVDGDSLNPNPELIEYAVDKGLYFSKYIGKKALYNLIYESLSLKDRIAFFCFSVYRHLSDDRQGNLDKHRHKNLFYEFAESEINNDKFLKSLGKYTGEDIRFFGTLKFPDGGVTYGGSVNTIAFKTCALFLCKKLSLKLVTTKKVNSNKNNEGGWCSVLIIAISIIITIFVVCKFT